MDFYHRLSAYYDEIFPARKEEMRFVRNLLAGRRRVLDIGCGTGNKTAAMNLDAEVTAFDADPGMIETAERLHASTGIRYAVLDMLRMDEAFMPASFDAALCLGNTLAHLVHPGDLSAFLRLTRGLLTDEGAFVAQILNYDRITLQGVSALPLIETEHAVFRRNYDWRGGEMHFVTELTDKADGATYRNDIVLLPILKSSLDSLLGESGFGLIEHYGSYAGEPFQSDSFHLIVRAFADKRRASCRQP